MESCRNCYDELLILNMNNYFYTWVVLKNDSTEDILMKIENAFKDTTLQRSFPICKRHTKTGESLVEYFTDHYGYEDDRIKYLGTTNNLEEFINNFRVTRELER